jgi:hypothetical protein
MELFEYWRLESQQDDNPATMVEELEREIKQLRKDALIMVLRLLGEDEETFSPEVKIVMDRWRPIARAALQQANSVFYAASG